MLDDNFERGRPLASLSARWLNEVARILNHLRITLTDDDLPSIEKPAHTSAASPWTIRIPRGNGGNASDPEHGGGGTGEGGITKPIKLPSILYWNEASKTLFEREVKFDGTRFYTTNVSRAIVTFSPVTFGAVVTNVSNTGEAITKSTKVIRVYAPNGSTPGEETGDVQTTQIIALTPRDANESTPYGDDATEV